MKILVTGATGFIGKAVCTALKEISYHVIEINSKNGNILNDETWNSLPYCEVLIHLAAQTFVPHSWANPASFVEINSFGTLKALEYCRKHNSKMIYVSSYLYGNSISFPINESAELFTPNPYALSKKIAEEYCSFYANNFSLKCVILRPFNIYGPGQSPIFLIPEIINQIVKNKHIKVKDLEPKRDYIYIDDFISAVISSIYLDKFEIINIGAGKSYSVGNIINEIQNILGTNYAVLSNNEKRQGEIMDTIADISKAKKILNWEPKINLHEGLSKIIKNMYNEYR